MRVQDKNNATLSIMLLALLCAGCVTWQQRWYYVGNLHNPKREVYVKQLDDGDSVMVLTWNLKKDRIIQVDKYFKDY